MFRYHHHVDLFSLREAGIRTFREVEEVIEGHSFAERSTSEKVYYYTGFTNESKPLEVIIAEVDTGEDIELVTLGVSRPSVRDIINHFCRHCH